MGENLFCDLCQQPAIVFSIIQPKGKVKVCSAHVGKLQSEPNVMYSIQAFQFMEAPEHYAEWDERRRTEGDATGKLDAIERQWEADLKRQQLRIETHSEQMFACLKRIYAQIRLLAEKRNESVKQQLQTARNNLRRYTQDRFFSNRAEDFVIDAGFSKEAADCRLSIAKTLLHAVRLSCEFSEPALDPENELKLLLEEAVKADACEKSAAACKRGDFAAAVAELERGRSVLQSHSRSSLDLPLVCTYFQSQQYNPAISLCQEILRTEHSSLERLSALFYLTESLYIVKEFEEVHVQSEKWIQELAADGDIQLFTQAHILFMQERNDEAKEQYEKALQLHVLPSSYIIALALEDLGSIYHADGSWVKAEKQWLDSCSIYAEQFPYSYDYGCCLTHLGTMYVSMDRLEEAENSLVQAEQLLSSHFPQSKCMGVCLLRLEKLCEKREHSCLLREKLEKALPLLIQHGQKSDAAEAEDALKN